jgi:hypothetical protein
LQRSGAPQAGGGSRGRESLWQRMGACMDRLHSILLAAWHLQRVLSKKRDPISHIGFLDEVMQVRDCYVRALLLRRENKIGDLEVAQSFS